MQKIEKFYKWTALSGMLAILGTTALGFAEETPPSSIVLRGANPFPSLFDPLPATTIDNPLWKDGVIATLNFDRRADQRLIRTKQDSSRIEYKETAIVMGPESQRGTETKPADSSFESKWTLHGKDTTGSNSGQDPTFILENEELIFGKDLLKLPLPMSKADFEQAMKDRKMEPDPKLYDQYRENHLQQSMAALNVSRALDHEALKRKLPAHVSNKRVEYVVRSLLIRNAVDQKKVLTQKIPLLDSNGAPLTDAKGIPLTRNAPQENMAKYSDADLYAWLQELVATKTVSFYFDWTFQDGGMDEALQDLRAETAFNWPKFVKTENNPLIRFAGVPSKVEDFREQIRLKLESVNTSLRRGTIWQTLLAESALGIDLQFRVLPGEFEKMYQTTFSTKSAAELIDVPRMEAKVREVTITGAKASDFKKRFEALLALKSEEATKAIFGDGTTQMTPEEELAAKAKINDLRKTAPEEILALLKAEFAADISAKTIQIESKAKSFQKSELDPLPPASDMTAEAQEMRIAFNPLFGIQSLLPETPISGASEGSLLMLLEELSSLAAEQVGIKDSRIRKNLWKKIQLKTQANSFREITYNLLRRNTLKVENDTCLDSNWNCITTSPKLLTDALFPEALCADSTMPDTSSLGRPDLLDRVYQISLELFGQAFEVGTK
ncbi:hypothetical protein WDW86_16980 [Bdellovibrionota bacterium FG-2]